MPKVGLSRPYVAVYADNGAGTVSYSRGVRAGRAVEYSFTLNDTGADNTFYADNEAAESASGEFSGGSLSWTVAELEQAISQLILGLHTEQLQVGEDTVNELVYDDTMASPYLGAGIIVKSIVRGQTKWRAVVFPKVQFAVPEDAATTQGETIDWQTDTITASVLRDDSDTHKWRRTAVFDSESKADAYICHVLNITGAALEDLTVKSAAGASAGTTKLTVTPELTEGRFYRYKTGPNAQVPALYQDLSDWTEWDGASDEVASATGTGYVEGANEQAGSVGEASSGLVEAGEQAFDEAEPGLVSQATETGTATGESFASGIESTEEEVDDSAATVARSVGDAMQDTVDGIVLDPPEMATPDWTSAAAQGRSGMQSYLNNNPLTVRVNQVTGSRVNYNAYAEGGIVDKPEISLVGEAGAEAIIPLENNRARALDLWREAGERLNAFAAEQGRTVGSAVRERLVQQNEDNHREMHFAEGAVVIHTQAVDGRRLYREFTKEMQHDVKSKEAAYGKNL